MIVTAKKFHQWSAVSAQGVFSAFVSNTWDERAFHALSPERSAACEFTGRSFLGTGSPCSFLWSRQCTISSYLVTGVCSFGVSSWARERYTDRIWDELRSTSSPQSLGSHWFSKGLAFSRSPGFVHIWLYSFASAIREFFFFQTHVSDKNSGLIVRAIFIENFLHRQRFALRWVEINLQSWIFRAYFHWEKSRFTNKRAENRKESRCPFFCSRALSLSWFPVMI